MACPYLFQSFTCSIAKYVIYGMGREGKEFASFHGLLLGKLLRQASKNLRLLSPVLNWVASTPTYKQRVGGSIPSTPTEKDLLIRDLFYLLYYHYIFIHLFNLNATYPSPDFDPTFPPPPAAITIYCIPSTIYVDGVAYPPAGSLYSHSNLPFSLSNIRSFSS